MSHLAFSLVDCPNLQAELVNQFNTCPVSEPIPFMEFLGSQINSTGLIQNIAPGGGKVRTIDLVYTQRLMEDEVAENQPNPNCTATDQQGDLSSQYTIDTSENLQVNRYIDPIDLERICKTNPQFIAENIFAMVDVMDRKLATKHAADAALLYGKYASDVEGVDVSDNLVVKTKKDGSTQELDPFTMEEIDMAALQTGYCGTRMLFAGTELWKYYRRIQAGCCAQQGIDLKEILDLYGTAVMYDSRVATALGDNTYGLLTQPQALILLHYTRAGWQEGVEPVIHTLGAESFRAIVSPRTGVPMDLMVKVDCGKIHITLTATTKLVGMPVDMFHPGDRYEGRTLVNKVKVTNI